MDTELTYKIALSMTDGVNADVARLLDSQKISLEQFFTLPMDELQAMGSEDVRMKFPQLNRQEALFKARREEEFIRQHNIRALYITDDEYPLLLADVTDAPVMIYVLGDADLNSLPTMSLVGTRRCTQYGTGVTKSIVEDVAAYLRNMTVISGLAYGIDAAAHTAAIDQGLKTIAVVAHGLDMIYPAVHRDLAKRILADGGAIISEYPRGTRPFPGNFLQRNRIVAAMSEVTIVAESDVRGGAMSTARIAMSYGREVYAVPGRTSDKFSSGCNHLIAKNTAHIFVSAAELISMMGWHVPIIGKLPEPKNLFPELEGDRKIVYEFLQRHNSPASVDEMHQGTSLPVSKLMGALTELEFEGIVNRLPGARYEL